MLIIAIFAFEDYMLYQLSSTPVGTNCFYTWRLTSVCMIKTRCYQGHITTLSTGFENTPTQFPGFLFSLPLGARRRACAFKKIILKLYTSDANRSVSKYGLVSVNFDLKNTSVVVFLQSVRTVSLIEKVARYVVRPLQMSLATYRQSLHVRSSVSVISLFPMLSCSYEAWPFESPHCYQQIMIISEKIISKKRIGGIKGLYLFRIKCRQ